MKKPDIHPHISFALRNITSSNSTFNASSALSRLEALIEDAKSLDALIKEQNGLHIEIASYYTVGFVTCLEWHARSRLYDLFTIRPQSVSAADIKQNVSDAKLAQMVSKGLSVAHLIAASTNVSSSGKYLDIFQKIFDDIPVNVNVRESVFRLGTDNSEARSLGHFSSLFNYRNDLVHEIDATKVGHWNIRDNLSFSEAINFGQTALAVLKSIESILTRTAPEEFPNLLSDAGHPLDEADYLKKRIAQLECKIEAKIKDNSWDCDTDTRIRNWQQALTQSRLALDFELCFTDDLRPVA